MNKTVVNPEVRAPVGIVFGLTVDHILRKALLDSFIVIKITVLEPTCTWVL